MSIHPWLLNTYNLPECIFCLVLEQWWPKDTPFVSELDLWEANERIVEQALILYYSPKWKLPRFIFSYILENFVNISVFKYLICSKFVIFVCTELAEFLKIYPHRCSSWKLWNKQLIKFAWHLQNELWKIPIKFCNCSFIIFSDDF